VTSDGVQEKGKGGRLSKHATKKRRGVRPIFIRCLSINPSFLPPPPPLPPLPPSRKLISLAALSCNHRRRMRNLAAVAPCPSGTAPSCLHPAFLSFSSRLPLAPFLQLASKRLSVRLTLFNHPLQPLILICTQDQHSSDSLSKIK
jgi:hypothetical protein